MTSTGRRVRLVVSRPDGEWVPLEPFDVETPWWQDTLPVVAGARAHQGLDVTVVRILATEPDRWPPNGGAVTYLAEIVGEPPGPDLDPHPLRMPWAVPGGVACLVEWADRHVTRTGPAEQHRTWNLSCVLRLPTTNGPVWLKAVPSWFAHEGEVLARLGDLVPPVLAVGDGAVLLGDAEGEDLYDAPPAVREAMAARWRAVQDAWTTRVDELLAAGVPDRRWSVLGPRREALGDRAGGGDVVRRLLADVDPVPTLVHGDFHPGNWRGSAARMVLLDWGDSFVGDPRFDHGPEDVLHALRGALVYQEFLDNIEPAERAYHRRDPRDCVDRAVALAQAARGA